MPRKHCEPELKPLRRNEHARRARRADHFEAFNAPMIAADCGFSAGPSPDNRSRNVTSTTGRAHPPTSSRRSSHSTTGSASRQPRLRRAGRQRPQHCATPANCCRRSPLKRLRPPRRRPWNGAQSTRDAQASPAGASSFGTGRAYANSAKLSRCSTKVG
jgi:hypothetical protein